MKSHFLAAFTMLKNSKKCLVPGKNAYLVNLVPEKVNLVLASKIIWQQWPAPPAARRGRGATQPFVTSVSGFRTSFVRGGHMNSM